MTSADTIGTEELPPDVAPWEVGGYFACVPLPSSPCLQFPKRSVYYALGRHCVVELLKVLRPKVRRRLWVPSYFCFDVIRCWSKWYEIRFYQDDPRWPEPNWRTLSPVPSDVVVSVNYFGHREPHTWTQWRHQTSCTLVEDHTHDPLSAWARTSDADYAFSSLRKTLPIPDGALLWSPKRRSLPRPPMSDGSTGASQRLCAMSWKAEYLTGKGDFGLKQKYRGLLHESEAHLEALRPLGMSSFSRNYATRGIPEQWRRQRAENVRFLADELAACSAARPLFSKWPEEASPVGLVLVFRSATERDRYRSLLATRDVYCPIHWICEQSPYSSARNLSARVLTIPADQRYTIRDMRKVVRILMGIGPGVDSVRR